MPIIPNLRLITFDLDNTLWPSAAVLEAAEQALHDWLHTHYPSLSGAYGITELRELRREIAETRPELSHDLTALRHTTLQLAAQRTGCPSQLADSAMGIFLQARNRVTLYEEVEEALDRLRRYYLLGALSNGNADVFQTPAGAWFDFALTTSRVGSAKPDPAMFRAALTHAGVSPREGLHIGDEPEIDILGAQRVGMATAWINRVNLDWPREQPRPDIEVKNLQELVHWLDSGPASVRRTLQKPHHHA